MTGKPNHQDWKGLDRRRFLAQMAAGAVSGVAATGLINSSVAAGTIRWKMRLSTSTVMFNTLRFEQACERIASLGFEAIDIWPDAFKCPHLNEIEQRLGPAGLKEVLTKNGLRLYAVTCYQVGYPRYAELLGGAGGGVAVRESVYKVPSTGPELVPRMKEMFESLKPQIELAEKHDSFVAIENHGNALLNSLDSFKAFVELNPSSRIGIALAPLHLQNRDVSVTDAIAVAGSQLMFFYGWQLGKKLEQLPGIGPADFTPWLAALAEVDYRWYVNPFTHWHVEPDEMAKTLVKSRDYLKACYRKLD